MDANEIEKFFNGLSEAEWDTAAAIETEIEKLLKEGLSEETGVRFVRAVLEMRKALPSATVEGVFEVALKAGLSYVEALQIKPAVGVKLKRFRRGKLAGAGV